jgi:PIN domain nuclease of toxin-antitoxin system
LRLLLDTNALLWAMLAPWNLSAKAADLLADPGNMLFISIASLWEITIKVGLGKLAIPNADIELFIANLDAFRIRVLPIRSEDLIALQRLASHHKDPFDRILVCQAQVEGMPIVTTDKMIPLYDVRAIW